MTIKSGAWIRRLNVILARGGGGGGEWDGNLKERIFKSSNAREIAQEGDVETSNKSTHTTFKNSPKVKNVICLFAYN